MSKTVVRTVERAFRETIARHGMIRPGDRVLAAVSGGADSIALLALLRGAAEELRIAIHVAHLNHGWRGKAADRDAEFVRRTALRLGLPVTVGQLPPGAFSAGADGVGRRQSSVEARARVVRMRFLRDTARATGSTRIALGHTRDDQAESFLLRLMRGSGARGLAGTWPVLDGLFVRPLLDLRRRDLIPYLRARRLRWRADATNRDLRLTRNRIRRTLLPRLERDYNPEVVEALAGAADILRDEEILLAALADEAYTRMAREDSGGLSLAVSDLDGLPPAIRRRVVRRACAGVRGHLLRLTHRHVERILALAAADRGGLALPDGLRATAGAGRLRLGLDRPAAGGDPEPIREALCPIPGEVALPAFGIRLRAQVLDRGARPPLAGPGRACLDADKIAGPLLIRPRRPGDRFVPLGGPGSRKVKSFLIDHKVPLDERGRIPLVLAAGRIAWVVGHRIDDRFKVTPETRRVLVLEKEPR